MLENQNGYIDDIGIRKYTLFLIEVIKNEETHKAEKWFEWKNCCAWR